MKSSLSNKKTINKYMEAVNKIIKNSNKQAIKLGIFHLQNHLTRQIQARAIEQVIIGDEWEKEEEWLLTCIYKMPHEYIKSGTDIKVNISSFPCVSFVASKTRLINCFKWIGYPVNPSYNIFKVFISYIEAGNLINLCYFFMVFPHIF